MATKPRFRIRSAALAATATAICLLATASPTLADTGSVYTDANGNVGAGHDFFSGSFSGSNNVGVGYSVMPNLTTGNFNVASGQNALQPDAMSWRPERIRCSGTPTTRQHRRRL